MSRRSDTYPRECVKGHVMRSEADTLRSGGNYPECRECNRERTRRRRARFTAQGLTIEGRPRGASSFQP